MSVMLIKVVVLTALLCFLKNVETAKILGVFPVPTRSHYNLYSPLLKELHARGHEITVITSYAEKEAKTGYREIVLDDFADMMKGTMKTMNPFESTDRNPFVRGAIVSKMVLQIADKTIVHPKVQKLLHSNETFDLVILEQFINNGQRTFATVFKAPMIILSTIGANYWINNGVGNPAPLSYVPDAFLEYHSQMNFCERLVNTLYYVYTDLLHRFYIFPHEIDGVNKHIPSKPDFYDAYYNVSLVLLNSHTSINQPVPYVPNMIDIGGYHIKPPKPLPDDLKKFLDDAPNGVVYFSMGSNIKSVDLPVEKRDAILKVFGSLKAKVLWKWEDDVLPGQPKNVKLSKWLPQSDLLAHPNIRLFITHGGLLSTTETIYHGVPVLAIPIYGDQKLNAQRAVSSGYGLAIEFRKLNEETFRHKINELLTNSKYKEMAKRRSTLFHDRIVKPMDLAVYWVEYVIRHKGAPHLRVAGAGMPFYKYFLLDVVGFIAGVCLTVVLAVAFVLKKIFCRKRSPQKQKKQ